ncbi:RNA polymerase sigma factor [Nocardia sp. NPDC052566]|uniref:RNA polymerase sigma factor n=1 Tax=Nocardia sp. NPDC052566 TaxID=3364330 RepID=UPI0037CAC8D8
MTDLMRDQGSPPESEERLSGRTAEFEELYRAHIGLVLSYFARRTTDPQTAADLTADTFVEAITSFGSFDAQRGTGRGWLLTIARRVYARHCESATRNRDTLARLGGHRQIDDDEATELLARIDAEASGRGLMAALAALPALDRHAIELVDIAGLTPKEAAVALGVSSGTLRVRLFRARTRLRKQTGHDAMNTKGSK